MATRLFLRPTHDNGIGSSLNCDMITTAGSSALIMSVNTASGGTEIQWTDGAGGGIVQWYSGRVPAGGFTLTSTFVGLWMYESASQANCGGRFRVFKRTSGGTETELGGGPFNHGTEFTTTSAEYTWTGNVTDTAFAEDDRILLKVYITNVGTMGSGRTCGLKFDGPTAGVDGGSYFQIAETVAFKAEGAPVTAGTRVKHSGTWKNATTWVKHSGTWKTATTWVKHSGTWKQS